MKHITRYEKSIYMLVAIIPFINQLHNLGLNIEKLIYIPFIGIILCFLTMKKNKNDLIVNLEIKFSNGAGFIFICMILSYILSPIIGLTLFKYDPISNIMYISLFIIFILALIILHTTINTEQRYYYTLKSLLCGNSIVLIFNLLKNITDISDINFSTILTSDREVRAIYGFSHPNTVSMFLLVEMLLIYLILKKYKREKYRIVSSISIFTLLIFLISTGSRTAILVVCLFILLSILDKLKEKLAIKLKICLNIVIMVVIMLFLLYKFDLNVFLANSSGRDTAIIQNISSVIKYGTILYGIAPVNISILNEPCNLGFTDNWFIVQLIQFGLIGIIFMIFCIGKMFKIYNKNKNYTCMNLLISILFYGFAERVVFVPGVLLSVIIWIILIVNLNIDGKNFERSDFIR